jgi:hypothetical protein
MLVGPVYFPHLREAEEERRRVELERWRVAMERAGELKPAWWRRAADVFRAHRRRVVEGRQAIEEAAAGVLPQCATD